MNCTDRFVDYIINKSKMIEPEIIRKAEECKFDYEAVVCAGARKSKTGWGEFLNHLPTGNSFLFGYEKKTDSKTAALINGFNAHCLEFDDGQRFAMIHLGASIISAIEAVRGDYEVSDRAYFTGIIMGYEAACRVAITMQPSHKNKGYHAAGTCGTIGSAVGVAVALEMDEVQLKRAVTLAVASSAGLLEIQAQGSELKPYNLGRAAMDGLSAALMGYSEYKTPDDVLGGERGFFNTFSNVWDAEKLIEKKDYFEIERIYVKPYASCRHSHSAVEAAIKLHDQINISDIDRVEVKTYKLGVKGHDHTYIQGIASAKLSTPYAVAAGLKYGRADLTVFEPVDTELVKLAANIHIIEEPRLTMEDSKRIAIVTVFTKDGFSKSCRVDYARGEPENPLSPTELKEKKKMLDEFYKIGGLR